MDPVLFFSEPVSSPLSPTLDFKLVFPFCPAVFPGFNAVMQEYTSRTPAVSCSTMQYQYPSVSDLQFQKKKVSCSRPTKKLFTTSSKQRQLFSRSSQSPQSNPNVKRILVQDIWSQTHRKERNARSVPSAMNMLWESHHAVMPLCPIAPQLFVMSTTAIFCHL